jgi:glycolate oxidase FAD binding subunit
MPLGLAGRERLSIADYRGVVDYQPDELVVTVRAGTPLDELDAVLGERNQMLAAEAPNFNGGSTIGGAVALGWAGSRSAFVAGLRDAVIGLRMINGLGEDLRFGGRVMKNVAGFDVSRLLVGSCGRLGVITELSLRVLPRPRDEITLQWPVANATAMRERVAGWLLQGYPVTAACFAEGLMRVRFSGATGLLRQVAGESGGEPGDDRFWVDLRRLQLPLFHHGWGDEKLLDGNGEICWSAHTRRRGAGPLVNLARGPQSRLPHTALGQLQARVDAAFDPGGVFRAVEAA